MNSTVNDLATRWLASLHSPPLHLRTIETYRSHVDHHVTPILGHLLLRDLKRATVQQCVEQLLRNNYSVRTVRAVLGILRSLAAIGVEDGHLSSNPCDGVAKALRLTTKHSDTVKAMDADQLQRFLATVTACYPATFPLFLTLARTGLRLGEALALTWNDVDFAKRQLRIRASLDPAGRRGPTKTGRERHVDISSQLGSVLAMHRVHHEREGAQLHDRQHDHREPGGEVVVFRTPRSHAQYVARRVCQLAGLDHHSPHHLRHTFATLHLIAGHPIQYVQRQLGHSSISLTCDLYGKWLAMKCPEYADALDTESA